MADEQTGQQAVETPPTPQAEAMAAERAVAEAAAAGFFAEQQPQEIPVEEKPADTRQRDANGRFLRPETPSAVSRVWQEAAKQHGFTDEEVSAFSSDVQAQQKIGERRLTEQIRAIQTLGIDPQQFSAFQQWQQGQRQPQGQGQQTPSATTSQQPPNTVATSLDDLKLDLNEDEVAPEIAQQLKAMNDYVNRLKATALTENTKLRTEMQELQQQLRQSAEAVTRAQAAAAESAQWDQVAADVPGFVEYFGTPSDLDRMAQQNPRAAIVRDADTFNRNYLLPKLDEYERVLGVNHPSAKLLALQDAWAESPWSKLSATPKNGTNGKNSYGPGSVVRSSGRKPSAAEPAPSDDIQAEYNRLMQVVGEQWDRMGGNPFS